MTRRSPTPAPTDRGERMSTPSQPGDVRFTNTIVAVYRPHPVVDPWHCYNSTTGEFIEARTEAGMVQFGPYHRLPAASAPQSDTADVIERATRVMHDNECGCDDWSDDHVITEDAVGAPNSYLERTRALSAAGLLAASPVAPRAASAVDQRVTELTALADRIDTPILGDTAWGRGHDEGRRTSAAMIRTRIAALQASVPAPAGDEAGFDRTAAHTEAAADRADDEAAAGWLVAGYEHGRLVADWDGDVHVTREDGLTSLAQCRKGYPDWDLYELRPTTTEGAVLRRSEAESAVERVRSLLDGRRKTVRADDIHAALAALKEGQKA